MKIKNIIKQNRKDNRTVKDEESDTNGKCKGAIFNK